MTGFRADLSFCKVNIAFLCSQISEQTGIWQYCTMEDGYALRHSAENHLRDESILTFFLLGCYNIVGRTISMRRPFSVMGAY